MGEKLRTVVGGIIGGLVALAGQQGVNHYNNLKETERKHTEVMINAPQFLNINNYDGEDYISYYDRQSVRDMHVIAVSHHGAEFDLKKRLENSPRSGTELFKLPNFDFSGEYEFYAIDCDGNKSKKTTLVHRDGKWKEAK